MTVIECKNLCLSYGSVPVIKDLSFAVKEGQCVCVAGENGTGKSTLLNLIYGTLKPYRGKIISNKVPYIPYIK